MNYMSKSSAPGGSDAGCYNFKYSHLGNSSGMAVWSSVPTEYQCGEAVNEDDEDEKYVSLCGEDDCYSSECEEC